MKSFLVYVSDHKIVAISTAVALPYCKPTVINILLWHRAEFELINNHIIAQFTVTFMNTAHDNNIPIDMLWNQWNEYKTLCKQCLDLIPQNVLSPKHVHSGSQVK